MIGGHCAQENCVVDEKAFGVDLIRGILDRSQGGVDIRIRKVALLSCMLATTPSLTSDGTMAMNGAMLDFGSEV